MLVISRCVEMDVCAETAVCIVLFFFNIFCLLFIDQILFFGEGEVRWVVCRRQGAGGGNETIVEDKMRSN